MKVQSSRTGVQFHPLPCKLAEELRLFGHVRQEVTNLFDVGLAVFQAGRPLQIGHELLRPGWHGPDNRRLAVKISSEQTPPSRRPSGSGIFS